MSATPALGLIPGPQIAGAYHVTLQADWQGPSIEGDCIAQAWPILQFNRLGMQATCCTMASKPLVNLVESAADIVRACRLCNFDRFILYSMCPEALAVRVSLRE